MWATGVPCTTTLPMLLAVEGDGQVGAATPMTLQTCCDFSGEAAVMGRKRRERCDACGELTPSPMVCCRRGEA